MARPDEYTSRGTATSFDTQDVSFWDGGDDHKLTFQCTTDLSADDTYDVGQLLSWTMSTGTYSSVEYASLLPTSATANVAAVIGGKGTGSIQAQVSDGTSTGGDNRGSNCVDLQQTRAAANQVAGGTGSCVPGGTENRATGNYSYAMGQTCYASALTSTAVGRDCTSDANYSHAKGRFAHTQGRYGSDVFASDRFSADGDGQLGKMVLYGTSTSATPITLTSDGTGTASTSNILVLVSDSALMFKGRVLAYDTTNNQVTAFEIHGVAKRPAAAGGTVTLDSIAIMRYRNVSTTTVSVSADTTNGGVSVSFTGAASKTYNVVCDIDWIEVQ